MCRFIASRPSMVFTYDLRRFAYSSRPCGAPGLFRRRFLLVDLADVKTVHWDLLQAHLFAEEEEVAGYELSHRSDLNQDDHLRPTSSEPKCNVTCMYMWSRHRLLNKAALIYLLLPTSSLNTICTSAPCAGKHSSRFVRNTAARESSTVRKIDKGRRTPYLVSYIYYPACRQAEK